MEKRLGLEMEFQSQSPFFAYERYLKTSPNGKEMSNTSS